MDKQDPRRKPVYGVGINDVYGIPTRSCQAYKVWKDMLGRCYSEKQQVNPRNKNYIGCSVDSDWHYFSNFKSWFYESYAGGRVQIDKDEKGCGKIYSAKNCQLVSAKRNIEISHAKNYKFISPKGESVLVYNLKQFCRDNNLMDCKMNMVWSGKRASHKGWRKVNEARSS